MEEVRRKLDRIPSAADAGCQIRTRTMNYTSSNNKILSKNQTSRGHAVNKTKQLLSRGPLQSEDILVQPAPTVHPEQLIPKVIANHDLQAVFIAPTKNQLAQMKSRCQGLNISTREISSPYSKCPSYDGTHGSSVENQIEDCIEQGIPLGLLHKNRDLPCCPNCPFNRWKRPDFTEQVILADPLHAYIDGLLEDRVIFTCALRGDAYIKKIDDPTRALDPYLDRNTRFTGYHDFIKNRNSGPAISLNDLIHERLDPSTDDIEFGYDLGSDGHHLAPQATFGLQHSAELDNGWETSFNYQKNTYGYLVPSNRPITGPDPFDLAGIDYHRTRVVRQPGKNIKKDIIYVLNVPNFDKAESVVAFDIAPTPWMWSAYYGVDFNHQRVYSDDETAEFLHNEMDLEVVPTAKNRKPYDGKYVTPGRDASIAVWATAEFGRHPFVVSTKNALGSYQSKQPGLINSDAKDVIQYRRGESVITDNSPLVIVNGAPRPRTEVIQLWGALGGKTVRNPNKNQSFERTGYKIRRQFSDSRVGQWATRFNSKNGTVILNTTAVPEWLQQPQLVAPAVPTGIFPANAPSKRDVARYLRDRAGTSVTMSDIQNGANVSQPTARQARKSLINYGWVVRHPMNGHAPDEYSWV